MAGAICHEMNQPMQIISGLSELLLMNTSDLQESSMSMGFMTTPLHKSEKGKEENGTEEDIGCRR